MIGATIMATKTRRPRKPLVIFASHCKDGVETLYVRLDAVMTPLVALVDGLPLRFFPPEKHAYLTIDEAIDWTTREIPLSSTPGDFRKRLEALKIAKQKFIDGDIDFK